MNPLEFHTKYLAHTLKGVYSIRRLKALLDLRARQRFWKAPPWICDEFDMMNMTANNILLL